MGGTGTIYIVWMDNRDGGREHIYFNKSTDGGKSFAGEDVRVDHETSSSYCPSMDINEQGNIYVAWNHWQEFSNIYSTKSLDGGASFDGNFVRVDDEVGNGCPHLSLDGRGYIHLLWLKGPCPTSHSNVYYDKSVDGGNTFGTDVRVDDGDSTCCFLNSAVDNGGDIYAIWSDRRDEGDNNIYFAMSADGGATFSEDMRIDHQEGVSSNPCMAADDNGYVYAVWDVSDAIYFNRFNAFATLGVKGDINLDAVIDILDVVLAVNIILEILHPTRYQQWAADYDGDDVVNIIDAILIVNWILGNDSSTAQQLIQSFKKEGGR